MAKKQFKVLEDAQESDIKKLDVEDSTDPKYQRVTFKDTTQVSKKRHQVENIESKILEYRRQLEELADEFKYEYITPSWGSMKLHKNGNELPEGISYEQRSAAKMACSGEPKPLHDETYEFFCDDGKVVVEGTETKGQYPRNHDGDYTLTAYVLKEKVFEATFMVRHDGDVEKLYFDGDSIEFLKKTALVTSTLDENLSGYRETLRFNELAEKEKNVKKKLNKYTKNIILE